MLHGELDSVEAIDRSDLKLVLTHSAVSEGNDTVLMQEELLGDFVRTEAQVRNHKYSH